MESEKISKILIVGDACRGKSTLAEKLSKKLGIPNYSTDDYFYEVKFSKKRDKQESIRLLSKIFEENKWIVEGTTRHLFKHGLDLADVIIYLEHKNVVAQWFLIFRRFLQRENETLRKSLGLMKHVLYKKYKLGYKKGEPTVSEIIQPYKHKVVTLYSFKEIDSFFNAL
jgi:adenylate kinase family enzyme